MYFINPKCVVEFGNDQKIDYFIISPYVRWFVDETYILAHAEHAMRPKKNWSARSKSKLVVGCFGPICNNFSAYSACHTNIKRTLNMRLKFKMANTSL